MKSSVLKIVLSLVIAVLVGGAYYFYAKPNNGRVAYIAATNIVEGEKIQPNMIRWVHVTGNVPEINSGDIIGKVAKTSIKAGEWISPSLLTKDENNAVRYYTLKENYVQANGPLLQQGMKVDVWMKASDKGPAQKVLSDVTVAKIVSASNNGDKIAVGQDVNVVLALKEDQIASIEAADKQSDLFLVIKGDQIN
jgi:hypothetical protein